MSYIFKSMNKENSKMLKKKKKNKPGILGEQKQPAVFASPVCPNPQLLLWDSDD